MKSTITGLLFCVVTLVGAGVWIGYNAGNKTQAAAVDPVLYNQIYENGKTAAIREIAACTIEEAHKDLCSIPCASDEDCLQKNGREDH